MKILIFYWIYWVFAFINSTQSLSLKHYEIDVNDSTTEILAIYKKINYVTGFSSLFVISLGLFLINIYITNVWVFAGSLVALLLIDKIIYSLIETVLLRFGIKDIQKRLMKGYNHDS